LSQRAPNYPKAELNQAQLSALLLSVEKEHDSQALELEDFASAQVKTEERMRRVEPEVSH